MLSKLHYACVQNDSFPNDYEENQVKKPTGCGRVHYNMQSDTLDGSSHSTMSTQLREELPVIASLDDFRNLGCFQIKYSSGSNVCTYIITFCACVR